MVWLFWFYHYMSLDFENSIKSTYKALLNVNLGRYTTKSCCPHATGPTLDQAWQKAKKK